ncbi:MAG TPA: YneF family protein [Tenericutes bacterium]|nr:YneF family protein [Mycoplasmatota bacterium]
MWMDILYITIGLIIGAVLGFFLARHYMMRYLKKNPPINEQMIKTMMAQMGRVPSQKQVAQIMNSMNKYMQ